MIIYTIIYVLYVAIIQFTRTKKLKINNETYFAYLMENFIDMKTIITICNFQ